MGCACARSSFMVLTRMELSYCVWMKITIPHLGIIEAWGVDL